MVKKIRNLLWLVFFLVALILGTWIVVDNDRLVDFSLFGFSLPSQTLGFLVLVTFSIGLLMGLLGNVFVTAWMAIKLNRLQKRSPKQEVKPLSSGKVV